MTINDWVQNIILGLILITNVYTIGFIKGLADYLKSKLNERNNKTI